jgi:uncharacterized membrane protein
MHIKRHDRNVLWINIFFLMCVALIPFTTSLLQHYADQQLALVIYYGLLIFIGLVAEAMWNYATGGHRLTEPNLDPALVKSMHRRLLLAPAIYLLAIVITFVNVTAAKWIILGVALIYIAPSAVDYYHYRHLNPTDQAEPPAQETHT